MIVGKLPDLSITIILSLCSNCLFLFQFSEEIRLETGLLVHISNRNRKCTN